jgi:outer membrane protein assembly factor BamB
MKINLMALALAVAVATPVFADGGRGMGAGGGMMGGSGRMIVANDASLLVTEMDASGMMGGGPGTPGSVTRELVNIDANGNERWRVGFEDGWPMMPCTDGDLVVVVLVDDWFMGSGGFGDGGWTGGTGGGMGGGPGGGTGNGDGESVLIALDLTSGLEQWRTTIPGDMGSMVQFSEDGSRLYVSAREHGTEGEMGSGSMRQGQAAGAGFLMSTTIIAFDREGNQLWAHDIGGE